MDDAPLRPPLQSSAAQSFVFHRCSKNQSSSLSTIPGPAGAVQSAMKHRQRYGSSSDELREERNDVISTQECIRRAVQGGSDDDFRCNSWLSAIHYIRSQGLALADGEIGIPISAIKNVNRVDQVVAMIKSCIPNGLGDMMVILMDPTGNINASIHNSVFSDENLRKNTVAGTVLILRQVAVFSPVPSARCLNITQKNVVKIFSKNGNTMSSKNTAQVEANHSASIQKSGDAIILSLKHKLVTNQDTQFRKGNPLSGTASKSVDGASNIVSLNQEKEKEEILLDDDNDCDSLIIDSDLGFRKQDTNSDRNMRSNSPFSISANVAAEIINAKTVSSSSSRSSLPRWTDEQLDLLSAFD